MSKKLKENIKRVVSEGITLIKTQLKISPPSKKLDSALKRHSKKLIEDLKKELKKRSKKESKANRNVKNNKKVESAKKSRTIKSVSQKSIK